MKCAQRNIITTYLAFYHADCREKNKKPVVLHRRGKTFWQKGIYVAEGFYVNTPPNTD